MKPMREITIILLLVLPVSVLAQRNFTAGQVITSTGEIIKGEINYKEWVINPKKIKFRTDGEVREYGPKDLRSFRIDGKNEIYETAAVLVNPESLDWDELPQYQTFKQVDNQIDMYRDTVFLLTLVRGRIGLYQLIDDQKRIHFYFRKGNGAYEPLIYREIKVMRPDVLNSTSLVQEDDLPRRLIFEEYKGQLKYVMQDCGEMDSAIDKLTYSRSLVDVVQTYNECAGQLIYVKPRDRAASYVYAFGGTARSSFAIRDANNRAANDMPNSWSAVYGLGFEFGIPRSRGRFSWKIEALYMSGSSSVTTSPSILDIGSKAVHYTVDVEGVRFNGLLRYSLLSGRFQPYLQFGLGSSNYSERTFRTQDVNTKVTDQHSLLKTEPFLIGGGGLQYAGAFAEWRYITGNDINKVTGYDFRMSRMSITMGYRIAITKHRAGL